jgi:hypothetical protein
VGGLGGLGLAGHAEGSRGTLKSLGRRALEGGGTGPELRGDGWSFEPTTEAARSFGTRGRGLERIHACEGELLDTPGQPGMRWTSATDEFDPQNTVLAASGVVTTRPRCCHAAHEAKPCLG